MKQTRIGFIGGGNMARSLIGGLKADGCPPDLLWVSDPHAESLQQLRAAFGIHTSADNRELAAACETLVLAVKPQLLAEVARGIKDSVQEHRPLVISIAAGVRTKDLERWLGGDIEVVRVMPNTPALVQSGAAALYATPGVSTDHRDQAESIMRAVGLAVWIADEQLMDAVTAVSGSGPAYFLLVMEVMEKAAVATGLDPDTARLLTLQTAFGAAKMALESDVDAAELRRRVTSPGGTTERALEVLTAGKLEQLFAQAVDAARHRSEELADHLGDA